MNDTHPTRPSSRSQQLVRAAWWLHSLGALAFGVGIMAVARAGLAYAGDLLKVLAASWLLVFIALRFIVGARNVRPDENLARKGVRLITNYVIKNLYQQMFFFLVPLYAMSATWSLESRNFWLPVLLAVCAVLSTLDVVFDQFLMNQRALASLMYGLCFFALLNLMLPVVLKLTHLQALLVAAGATAPAVGLLMFNLRDVASWRGALLVVAATAGLVAAAWYGRIAVPPAPVAVTDAAVGHGTPGSHELLPSKKRRIARDQLQDLRCGTRLTAPGGLTDDYVHVWRRWGVNVARLAPEVLPADEEGATLMRSWLPHLPADPTGRWSCRVETRDGQLLGQASFRIE